MEQVGDSGGVPGPPGGSDLRGTGTDALSVTSPTLPEPGEFAAVDPASVTVSTVVSCIVTAVLGLLALPPLILSVTLDWWPMVPDWSRWLIWALAVALLSWLSMAWPRLEYRHLRYSLQEAGIVVRRGVIWRKLISVPRTRVQHTDVSQGPIQRRYGLATLTLHTAGTEQAAVAVEGLTYDLALAVRDFLLEGRRRGAAES